MKNIFQIFALSVCCALCVANVGYSASWKLLQNGVSIDTSSVVKDAGIVTVFVKIICSDEDASQLIKDFKLSKKPSYTVHEQAIDCKVRRNKILSYRIADAAGNIIAGNDVSNPEPVHIYPGSYGEIVYNAVCGTRR